MKVMYYGQFSMRSYRGGWLLDQDAQFNKAKAIAENAPNSWEWVWFLPATHLRASGDGRSSVDANVSYWEMEWAKNVLLARYDFQSREVTAAMSNLQPDVILCEVPEHVPALRIVARSVGCDPVIVAMYEHVDIYEETDRDRKGHMLRQVEGHIAADLSAFPLKGMLDEWMKHAEPIIHSVGETCNENKASVWPCIFSPAETNEHASKREDFDGVPKVFFAGRLSDEQRTKYGLFFDAVRELHEEGVKFETIVANPNHAMGWDVIKKRVPNLSDFRVSDRDSYFDALWKADVVPVLYPQSHIYSVGYLEAIAARCITVTVKGSSSDTCGNFMIDGLNVLSLKSALKGAIRLSMNDRDRAVESVMKWAMDTRSVERNIGVLVDEINSLVHAKRGRP